jgi:hypothetical protein
MKIKFESYHEECLTLNGTDTRPHTEAEIDLSLEELDYIRQNGCYKSQNAFNCVMETLCRVCTQIAKKDQDE